MRTVLVGAVGSTRVALRAMVNAGLPPAALVTLPLDRSGRHSTFVDLRTLAERAGVPVVEAANVNAPAVLERLQELAPEYLLVIGWSQICHDALLRVPSHGAIGYHPAALPENRGRAVIPWTILQGRTETGSTLFWMDQGMDSGDVLAQEIFPVAPDETAATLYDRHLRALGAMLDGVLPRLAAHAAPRTPQDHSRASYCAKRTAEDGLIDWTAPARQVWTLIRAVGRPYPGAFTFSRGTRVVIHEAEYVGEAPYWGMAGQVQRLDGDGALVQCGDRGHVLVRRVETDGMERRAADVLKIHERLTVH